MISQRQLFLNHLAQTSDAPLQLEVERAHGVWLFGPDGQKTLDFISGIGMSPLGHTHPAVVRAVGLDDPGRHDLPAADAGE